MITLGIDLGGTKIAVAAVESGVVLTKRQIPTPQGGFASVIEGMALTAEGILKAYPEIDRVGVGSPGPIDLRQGVVLFAPNIPGMEHAPLTASLRARLGLPVVLENDANAAGYAEHRYGAARDASSSLYVTISTGIGGGLFVEERVLHGANGIAGEIGHMTLLPGGPLCGCGHYGCWEALASGRAVAREASFSYGEPLTTQEVFTRAQAGEARALSVVDNAARFTGLGLANLQKTYDPDCFVIGGGMSQVGSFYLDRIRAAADEFCRGFPNVLLRPAQLGVDAGVIGAASVA